MHDCCESKAHEITALRTDYGHVLKVVFAINLVMFFMEFGGGLLARSTALLADSLDMFGDAAVYAVSLYVLHKSEQWQARAALLKGLLMAGFGAAVLVEVLQKVIAGVVPTASLMSMFGLLALLANTTCAVMLLRFRTGEINMRSTWVCSRNDVIANLGVVVAALGVAATRSAWPDILIGTLIAAIFFYSSFGVLRDSFRQLFSHTADAT
ncbi:MAG: cation diffusion facilitator family transporter [Candidatus Binatia bacterium]